MADRGLAVVGRPRDWRSPGSPDRLAPHKREFVAERDSFFIASVVAKVVETRAPPTFVGPFHACVMLPEANWSRSSFSSATNGWPCLKA